MTSPAEYKELVGPVLVVLGIPLQWLRQFERFGDKWIVIIAAAMGAAAYVVAHPFGDDWRYEILVAIPLIAGYASTVLGGTGISAAAAMSGITNKIPKTDSK